MKKDELLEEFFALGGNYKNFEKAKDLENRINNYLEEFPDDIHILDVSRLFKVYVTEFEAEDFEGACRLASPVVKRLSNLAIYRWELYDIRIVTIVLTWTKDFEEAIILWKKTLSALKKYIEHELYFKIEVVININLIERLLKADYYEINPNVEMERSNNIEKTFEECSDNNLALCEAKKEEFKVYKIITLIRIALFKRDFKGANKQLKRLKDLDKDLHKVMKGSITLYSANVEFINSSNQLSIICGMNMRISRENRGLTIADIAELLNYSDSHVNAMERGENAISLFSLYELAKSYGLTIDDFCYGVIKDKKIDKEKRAFEKLRIMSSGLDMDNLEALYRMAKHLQGQQRKSEKRIYTVYSDDDDTEE
jgi:transcriptional regulator with XRE-family HTH domain